MLTIEQCRGARGLLGWTQQDLADASGLSKTAINNFEKGHSDIKAESLRAIRIAFESADIEFMGQNGISQKTETFKTFRGSTAMNELITDIHQSVNSLKKEILIGYADPSLASRITTQKLFNHIDFLKNNDITQRVLCLNDCKQVLSPMDECRWVNENIPAATSTTFIYGDTFAMELWDKSMIIAIRSKEAVNAERERFEHLWAQAMEPYQSDSTANKTTTQKSGA